MMAYNMIAVVCACAVLAAVVTVGADEPAKGLASTQRAATSMATTKGTATSESSSRKSFSILVEKGQYIFVAAAVGPEGKKQKDGGLRPLVTVHLDPDAITPKWALEISVEQVDGQEDNITAWKWETIFRAEDRAGVLRKRDITSWRTQVSEAPKPQPVNIEMIDASDSVGIKGLQLYRIPYVKADGNLNYVIVAVARNPEIFPQVFAVDKKYFLFDWNTWCLVKDGWKHRPTSGAD